MGGFEGEFTVGHTGGKNCGGAGAAKRVDIDGVVRYESLGAGTAPSAKGEGGVGKVSEAGDGSRVSWEGRVGITNTSCGTALAGLADALDCRSVSTERRAMDGVAGAVSVFSSLFTLESSLCSMHACSCLCIADNWPCNSNRRSSLAPGTLALLDSVVEPTADSVVESTRSRVCVGMSGGLTAPAASCTRGAGGGVSIPTVKSSGEHDAIVDEELAKSAAGHISVVRGGVVKLGVEIGLKPGIDSADELRVNEVPRSELEGIERLMSL